MWVNWIELNWIKQFVMFYWLYKTRIGGALIHRQQTIYWILHKQNWAVSAFDCSEWSSEWNWPAKGSFHRSPVTGLAPLTYKPVFYAQFVSIVSAVVCSPQSVVRALYWLCKFTPNVYSLVHCCLTSYQLQYVALVLVSLDFVIFCTRHSEDVCCNIRCAQKAQTFVARR